MQKQEHLAIASVPIQQWGNLYEQGKALDAGTIFQELDLPFFAAEEETDRIPRSCPSERPGEEKNHERDGQRKEIQSQLEVLPEQGKTQEQQGREGMMLQIMEVSFMLDDIQLYMDTHPQDEHGLKFLKQILGKRKELLKEFTARYYPLTMDCMAGIYEQNPESECYCWEKGPMPWEGVCV